MKKYYLLTLAVLLSGSCLAEVEQQDVAVEEIQKSVVLCSVCSRSLPQRQLVLPCDHDICEQCMAAWFENEVSCDRCREEDLRAIKPASGLSKMWVGVGMITGAALLLIKKADDRYTRLSFANAAIDSDEELLLTDVEAGNADAVNPA